MGSVINNRCRSTNAQGISDYHTYANCILPIRGRQLYLEALQRYGTKDGNKERERERETETPTTTTNRQR